MAHEVRKLAERSSEAAKEISALIKESTQRVEEGAILGEKPGAALEKIIQGVEGTANKIGKIAEASVSKEDRFRCRQETRGNATRGCRASTRWYAVNSSSCEPAVTVACRQVDRVCLRLDDSSLKRKRMTVWGPSLALQASMRGVLGKMVVTSFC